VIGSLIHESQPSGIILVVPTPFGHLSDEEDAAEQAGT
jgi:hypothetical protein